MGTSDYIKYRNPAGRDHPHAYGDKLLRRAIFQGLVGSSPRVWGQVSAKKTVGTDTRIIPTRMGTSCSQRENYR